MQAFVHACSHACTRMCRENKTEKVAMFKGFMAVPYKDEKAMMEAVATHGPIAISYDAGDITMKCVRA